MAKIVIGANFGDEGKGVLTDSLAQPESIVVRFNGGGQAGHTVETPEGHRHVFKHVGSGSFHGAATMLAPKFLINPLILCPELEHLATVGIRPRILADASCRVTTPYDMMINQIAEEARGTSRHGSCGNGINETVVRSEDPRYVLSLYGLCNRGAARARLAAIRFQWLPQRLKALGVTPNSHWQHLLDSEHVYENWLQDAAKILDTVAVVDVAAWLKIIAKDNAPTVFEGAQGLGLDEQFGHFPYVTRSRTGLYNALNLIHTAGFGETEIYYITRAYLTRHGAGPLPHECDLPFPGITDSTNIVNQWQGRLRFALLDIHDLHTRLLRDINERPLFRHTLHLAVTCLDQVPDDMQWRDHGIPLTGSTKRFLEELYWRIQPDHLHAFLGPTRNDSVQIL